MSVNRNGPVFLRHTVLTSHNTVVMSQMTPENNIKYSAEIAS